MDSIVSIYIYVGYIYGGRDTTRRVLTIADFKTIEQFGKLVLNKNQHKKDFQLSTYTNYILHQFRRNETFVTQENNYQ